MFDIKHFLANLSHHPGVYQMLDAKNQVIYVGKAKDLKKRVTSYFSTRAKDPKTTSLVSHIHHIDVTITRNENEAVLLECNLIKKHRPRYNILLRDDKSYPYILITAHDFPRIELYRGQRKKDGIYFGPFPNSYAVRETISLLQKLFRMRTCRDSYYNARSRPCLLYQIGRCTAPCVDLISKDDYARNIDLAVKFLNGKNHEVIAALQKEMEVASLALDYELAGEYRDQINRLRQIQGKQYVSGGAGNADVVGLILQAGIVCIQLLTIRDGQVLGSRAYFPSIPAYTDNEDILSSFISQHYLSHSSHVESIPNEIIVNADLPDSELIENVLSEQSKHKVSVHHPIRGEKKRWLEMAETSAKQALTVHLFTKSNMEERVRALQQTLGLSSLPKRLECFDISHSSGEATVASCVVFDNEGPVKRDYRRFNITGIIGGDDPAAMRQVIERRFKRLQKDEAIMPDIVFIDGGPTQLASAQSVVDSLSITGVLLVGISKGAGRKPGYETLHRNDHPPIHLPADSMALHFVQQIRDEAHRFAITGHRHRRDKVRRHSTIELIPGIGAKRRRELLRYFGGIQGLTHASLEELIKVPGISRSLAERIFATLHDATV